MRRHPRGAVGPACLGCGLVFELITPTVRPDRRPTAGSVILCEECHYMNIMVDAVTLREATADERATYKLHLRRALGIVGP